MAATQAVVNQETGMRLRINHSHYSGQALLELAIFGSILLFCLSVFIQYGMSINYQEFMRMVSFRRALATSVSRNEAGANANTNMVFITDKFTPSADSPFRLKEYSPYAAQVSATYSDTLYRNPSPGSDFFLQGVDYMINENWQISQSFAAKLIANGYIYDPARHIFVDPNPRNQGSGKDSINLRPGYVTIGWSYVSDPCGQNEEGQPKTFWHRKTRTPDANTSAWEWQEVKGSEVQEGQMVDVDNDFIEEQVVKIDKQEQQTDEMGNIIQEAKVSGWVVLDPDAGDINLSYGRPNKEKKAREPYLDSDGVEVRQGLQSGYTKHSYTHNADGNRLVRWEGTKTINGVQKTGIENAEIVNNKEVLSREIILNNNVDGYRVSPETPPENLQRKGVDSEFKQEEGRKYFTEF